jgi:hypothetical protein
MEPFFVGSEISRPDWKALHDVGLPFRFLDLRELLESLHVRFRNGGVSVRLQGVESSLRGALVWYNPGSFDLLEGTLVGGEDSELGFLSRQFGAALSYFETWLAEQSRCIDSPARQRKWSNKIIQLAGLTRVLPEAVPDTLVVCDPSRLVAGQLVKHASESRMVSGSEAFFAQVLSAATLQRLRAGPTAPVIAQQFVSASHEYRTFFFGRESSTVEFPRDEQTSMVDVQFHPDRTAAGRVVEAPVEPMFWRRIRDALGLNFFAADYLLLDSSPVLLEVNPLFSWAWMPAPCVDRVADALRRFLG